jgi:hypothetical protein
MLRYDAAWLLEQYAEETPAYPGVPYALIGATPVYSIEREPGEFKLNDVVGLKPRLAYDETVVRLARFDPPSLCVQPCPYSQGVKSNYAMDGEGELRAILRTDYGRRLPPLSDARLSNGIGTAAIIFDRQGRPYLPRRAPRQSVFPGGYHCTASGEAVWQEDLTFESLFTANIQRELEEEVGLKETDLDWIRPVAFCREFLRAGKPQIFFAGRTSLTESDLTARRREAIARQIAAGRQEVMDDVAHTVKPGDCTIECWANLCLCGAANPGRSRLSGG